MRRGRCGRFRYSGNARRLQVVPKRRVAGMSDQSSERRSLSLRLRYRLFHSFFLLARPMTLGVRAAVLSQTGEVFLVRHSYVPGWHLPGGGVERRETALTALARELDEEANIALGATPHLFGVYHNIAASPRDHVLLYVCRDFTQRGERKPDLEIVESGFFAFDALPETTTPGTRRRLAEIAGKQPVSQTW